MTEEEQTHPYQIIGETIVVACMENLDKDSILPLLRTLGTLAAASADNQEVRCVILQFGRIEIDVFSLRKLAVPLRALKLARVQVVAVEMPAEMAAMVKTQGLDNLLKLVYKANLAVGEKRDESRASGSAEVPEKLPRMELRHFALIGQGIAAIFLAQYGDELKSSESTVHHAPRKYSPGVAGTVSFSANGISGTVALCFPKEVYLRASRELFKQEFSEVDSKLRDGPAEILNMSLGRTRTDLDREGIVFKVYIPKAVFPLEGSKNLTPLPCAVVTFKSKFGDFELEIGLDPTQAATVQ